MKIVFSKNPGQTKDLAQKVSKRIKLPAVIALWGDLGSGKTQFVKGLASGLKIRTRVTSPSFIVTKNYLFKKQGKICTLCHFDLYRIKHPKEIKNFGLEEIFHNPNSLIVVEWPKILRNKFPRHTYQFFFSYGKKKKERIIKFPSSLA